MIARLSRKQVYYSGGLDCNRNSSFQFFFATMFENSIRYYDGLVCVPIYPITDSIKATDFKYVSPPIVEVYTTKENLSKMKFVLILSMLVGFGSAARLGFHGSIYNYGNAGYLSPKQVAAMKRILTIKCIKKYGPRFC